MNSRALAADELARLPEDPAVYPLKLDLARESALVVSVDEAVFARESFLDDRMLGASTRGAWVPLAVLEGAAARTAGAEPQWIFHIGHCGSTLLSRVLSTSSRILALREPLPLRTLAEEACKRGRPHWRLGEAGFERLLDGMARLWGRVFRSDQRVLVKATSHCNDLAAPLLERPGSAGVALTISPRDYIATMLRQAGGSADLMGFAETRMMRLHRHLAVAPWRLAGMDPGEIAAMSWLTEVLALQRGDGGRLLWLDFDAFLDRPADALAAIVEHFDWPFGDREIESMVACEAFHHHAKAPEYRYRPADRRAQLDESAARNADTINAALRWLDRAVQDHPALQALPPLKTGAGA